ncbi:MAG: cache domain-containing protein, partial [Pseudoalteromonas sp.]
MQRISKKYMAGSGVLLVLLVCAFWFGRQYDLQQSAGQAKQQVTQLSRYLDTELARFSAIPHLVTDNQLLSGFIQNDNKSTNAVNNYLADIQQSSGASDVYLLDLKGDVIASSNWQLDYTYIGNNFAFRPYFYEAIAGNKVAYFALGLRSNERGIYFSEPIYKDDAVIGVVALKVNVSKFENDRQLLNASQTSHFYMTMSDGVIAIASKAPWRLNTLRTFSETERQALISKRSYLDHIPKKIVSHISSSRDIRLLNIMQGAGLAQYVFAESDIEQLNAKITVLVDVSSVNIAQVPRLFWLSVFYIITLAIGY